MSRRVNFLLDDATYEALIKLSKENHENSQRTVIRAIRELYQKEKRKRDETLPCKFTFVDLFAGIGGMRIAYEHAAGRCVYSNEWNTYSQDTYFANFREQPDGDITKVDARTIPDHDILVAGFPCQPFSIAGVSKKQSLGRKTGFEDKTQGTLFFDVCRILKAKRPKAFMLENVKILKAMTGQNVQNNYGISG